MEAVEITSDHDFGEGQLDPAVYENWSASKQERVSFRSPWQNGIAGDGWDAARSRFVIPLNERHLRRLLSECLRYFHHDRTHLGLKKDTPYSRAIPAQMPNPKIVALPRLGGLHHRYDVAA